MVKTGATDPASNNKLLSARNASIRVELRNILSEVVSLRGESVWSWFSVVDSMTKLVRSHVHSIVGGIGGVIPTKRLRVVWYYEINEWPRYIIYMPCHDQIHARNAIGHMNVFNDIAFYVKEVQLILLLLVVISIRILVKISADAWPRRLYYWKFYSGDNNGLPGVDYVQFLEQYKLCCNFVRSLADMRMYPTCFRRIHYVHKLY